MSTIRIESGTEIEGSVQGFVEDHVGLKEDWHLMFVPAGEITVEIRNAATGTGAAVITGHERGLNEASCLISEVTMDGSLIVHRNG